MTTIARMKMVHDKDPKQDLIDKIGDVSDYELFHNRILVAVYLRPEKTASGLYLAETSRSEDKFQGKVGLVLKAGPGAFVDDAVNKFYGTKVDVGDWVVFRTSDGWPANINGVLCRHLEDAHIVARIPAPDYVY